MSENLMDNKEFKKHPLWESFLGADNFEMFQKNLLHPIYLKPQMTSDTKEYISKVEKLLNCSYLEYEFIDTALTEAIFTFEKALRVRWTEIHSRPTKKTFATLIDWFYSNNYFEISNRRLHRMITGSS